MVELIPREPLFQVEVGDYRNFVYALLDWDSKKAAIFDPHLGIKEILGALRDHQFSLECILLTHSHWDHISGLNEIFVPGVNIPLYAHADDHHRIAPEFRDFLRPLADQERLRVGDMEIEVLWTPGHSAGGVCFYLHSLSPPALLSGDTVFIGDCGRTDLDTGSVAALFSSLQRLKKLSPLTRLFPGHHYAQALSSTLGEEFLKSPPFLCRSIEELEALP